MITDYKILNLYRIALDETWEKFTDRLYDTGLPLPTIHKVCTGRSMPNERTASKLDSFIATHEAEISAALTDKLIESQNAVGGR